MGRHVKIFRSKGGKPESGKFVEITAAYGEEDMHIDSGRLLVEDASSYSLPSTGMDFQVTNIQHSGHCSRAQASVVKSEVCLEGS